MDSLICYRFFFTLLIKIKIHQIGLWLWESVVLWWLLLSARQALIPSLSRLTNRQHLCYVTSTWLWFYYKKCLSLNFCFKLFAINTGCATDTRSACGDCANSGSGADNKGSVIMWICCSVQCRVSASSLSGASRLGTVYVHFTEWGSQCSL